MGWLSTTCFAKSFAEQFAKPFAEPAVKPFAEQCHPHRHGFVQRMRPYSENIF